MTSYQDETHDLASKDFAVNRSSRTAGLVAKRMLDVVAAGSALILLAPLFLILIRLVVRDGGSAFYAQRRIGFQGREFRCFKFRTMVPNAELHLKAMLDADAALREQYERYWKLDNDPRVTKIGRLLRRTSLDELPQFINVLTGEMSLVGPRPRSVSEVAFMEAQFTLASHYRNVKPGITGPWQVSGRNQLTLAEKAILDARYAQSWTLLGDLKLIFITCGVVLKGHGAG